jgi:4-amino-4-deoxy-L-arabinose transferase-like glycosyltransferase
VKHKLIGWALAAVVTMLVVANQHEVGFARDEIVYMQAGTRYADWWLDLAQGSPHDITKTWGGPRSTDNNREHPPFMKELYGLSHHVFFTKLHVLDEPTAYRLPAAVMHGILALLVFLMTLELWGLAEAVIAVLVLAFLPRALLHAGMATFDAPIMTLWFATVYAYWRALDGRRWPWQVGVVFGLALATKHTAVLLPFALGAHYVFVGVRNAGTRFVQYRWRVLASLAVLGPLVFFALWPWLWLDPFEHVRQWLAFHLDHVHYNFEYLGQNWNHPRFPWHVALVTTLFTVPVVTLVGAVLGAFVWFVPRRAHLERTGRGVKFVSARLQPTWPGLLLLLSAAASMGPFFLGTTPIFGAEKHWMPALPTLCIAAGVGIAWAGRGVARAVGERYRAAAVTTVASVVVLAAVVETVAAQPYALTWYNALAGGAPGGADLGMNRQFWGVAAKGVLPVVASQAPPAGTKPVYSHDASPAWWFYQRLGWLPRSLPDSGWEQSGIDHSQLAIVIHEKHFNRHDYLIWKAYGTVQPLYVLRAHGVPIVSVYRRPAR